MCLLIGLKLVIWKGSNGSPHREDKFMARVLVIEDEDHIWKIIQYKLKSEDHDPIWANDGLKAMKILEEIKPDLIISDIMVPYMDGIQILKEIKSRKELRDIPVIMLTSKSQEKDIIHGLEMGAQDYITKPFSPAELILRVNKALKLV
jgi:DNA-binding response OmpR family regulator